MDTSKRLEAVHFSREQLEYLQRIFPHTALSPAHSEAHMRYYFGQQSVLEFIGTKIKDYRVSTLQG